MVAGMNTFTAEGHARRMIETITPRKALSIALDRHELSQFDGRKSDATFWLTVAGTIERENPEVNW